MRGKTEDSSMVCHGSIFVLEVLNWIKVKRSTVFPRDIQPGGDNVSSWLQGLNPQQREAVETIEGPLLVLAGAGSGKTLVITRRIAYMIEKGISGRNILAVTFTNKAAKEMRERLQAMIGKDANRITLCTFHSLGWEILRQEIARNKRSDRFVIYDSADQMACLRQLSGRLRLNKSFDLGAIAARISAWKNAFVDPGKLECSDDPYDQAASIFYPEYEKALEGFAAVDFDDLICKPTRLMEGCADCKERWSTRFRYVLVDEYQDTNSAQLRLLQAIVGGHRNICVVGDDDQSIYGWRGAEVRNILGFEHDFPGCRKIFLMRNYRSVGNILALANHVISENLKRHPKSMSADRGMGEPVVMVVCEDGEKEAIWAAEDIQKQIDFGRYRPEQIAVLYRSNLLSRGLETALRSLNLKYRIVGGKSFFDKKEVKDLTAYLRLSIYPTDDISLRRVINFPTRGIGLKTLERLVGWAEQAEKPIWEAVKKVDRILDPGDRAIPAVKKFADTVSSLRERLRTGKKLTEAVYWLSDEIGLREEIEKTSGSNKAFEKRMQSIHEFVSDLTRYCERVERPSIRDFLRRLALIDQDQDEEDSQKGQLTLSTLHGAKGLEFELVYFIGLEEGLLPHEQVLNPKMTEALGSDLAEERRLCYVGITRAKNELYLTRAVSRLTHGKLRERAPSRFISQLPEGMVVVRDLTVPVDARDALAHLAKIKAALGG